MADFRLQTPERKKHSIRTAGRKKFKKPRIGLGTSGTTLNAQVSKSQGCQKEKRKSKKLKTYLKKIMKENFPNMAKGIGI